MKREDWLCPICGKPMNKTSRDFMTCIRGQPLHARLRALPDAWDLSLASKVSRRRFTIEGESGFWEYVPHMHTGAMGRCPEPGVIVGLVCLPGRKLPQIRSFRQVKPSGSRSLTS